MHEAIKAAVAKQDPQPAPCFAPVAEYPTARFCHVSPLMGSGDGMFYSGPWTNPISLANRIYTGSPFSHYAMVAKDSAETDIIQFTCVKGCSRDSLAEAVMKDPGRWYWGAINYEAFPEFNGLDAVDAATAMLGQGYGYRGILLQWLMRTAGTREIVYFSGGADNAWFRNHKFCSYGGDLWAKAGGEKAVLNRASQLVTPQDMAQSKLFMPLVALIP